MPQLIEDIYRMIAFGIKVNKITVLTIDGKFPRCYYKLEKEKNLQQCLDKLWESSFEIFIEK